MGCKPTTLSSGFESHLPHQKDNMNTKQKGNLGLAAAISYFINSLYTVAIPLNDSQAYDLIIEKNGSLFKVEVKTSEQISRDGVPVVSVKSSGGTYGKTYSNVATSTADLLFVHHLTGGNWLIPVTPDLPMVSINLGAKYLRYKV